MTRRSTRFWPASRVSSTTWKAIFAIEASPMPLLWHRRLSTPVRETLLLPSRDRGALDQQLPTLAHQGLGDTLSSTPTLACEQQCRGLALQLANRSLRCLLRRWRALAARLAALHIGNPRRETLLGCAKDLLFAVLCTARVVTEGPSFWSGASGSSPRLALTCKRSLRG